MMSSHSVLSIFSGRFSFVHQDPYIFRAERVLLELSKVAILLVEVVGGTYADGVEPIPETYERGGVAFLLKGHKLPLGVAPVLEGANHNVVFLLEFGGVEAPKLGGIENSAALLLQGV